MAEQAPTPAWRDRSVAVEIKAEDGTRTDVHVPGNWNERDWSAFRAAMRALGYAEVQTEGSAAVGFAPARSANSLFETGSRHAALIEVVQMMPMTRLRNVHVQSDGLTADLYVYKLGSEVTLSLRDRQQNLSV